nr:f-box protein pof9 [Quercus suber]
MIVYLYPGLSIPVSVAAAYQLSLTLPQADTRVMDTPTSRLLDLPIDILLLILPLLDVASFLNLTATCKTLHHPDLLYDRRYWSSLVRNTFRLPNQPVVQNHGRRWQQLYKRLLRQSRVYTWGNNEKACLGHSYGSSNEYLDRHMMGSAHRPRQARCCFPAEIQGIESLGVIADLQCGGWSTTLLTSKGALYTVGVIDGLAGGHAGGQHVMISPQPLRYPPGYVSPTERNDPSTALKQFSAGRAHVLGLADSGAIWTWQDIEHAALKVKFLLHETVEDGKGTGSGTVLKLVAGWSKSGALIQDCGIVIWEPLKRAPGDSSSEDAALVLESCAVPFTDARRKDSKHNAKAKYNNAASIDSVGEVQNFIILDSIVLFNTHLGKIFASQISWDDDHQRMEVPVEISVTNNLESDPSFVTDVQGSFQSFAVFTSAGEVLTSTHDRLMKVLQQQPTEQHLFTCIPALQHKNVISLAFGDYHFHALHSDGHITSYGKEPQACGALGLGVTGDFGSRLRGVQYQGANGDIGLVPHAYMEGRRIWFEEEKRKWMRYLAMGGASAHEAVERLVMTLGPGNMRCQGEVSEWIEQQGRDWETKLGVRTEDDDGLGAYFALSVAAAGWHSGALVLKNEALASRVKDACEVPDAADSEPDDMEPAPTNPAFAEQTVTGYTSIPPPLVQQQRPSFFSRQLAAVTDFYNWFLGAPPYNAPPPQSSPASTPRSIPVPHDRPIAIQALVTPRPGFRYRWANDHFPRLRLSDGTEMPGTIPFDEWRYGRPDFDLSAGL